MIVCYLRKGLLIVKGFKNKLLNTSSLFVNFSLVEIALITTKAEMVIFHTVYFLSITITNYLPTCDKLAIA